ncbi:Fic family protein [Brevibacterium gallinarum]|uniref:Fic family protein n=1 Tax=Brevibacterium gallinarum TaxID=2762220 RepID=A0ABR8WS79_9MICO|nr:Fic family protein [Brevibacterium gallinarum]MBD8019934.1 Fic family protein [Brevibacterium gallinarum]
MPISLSSGEAWRIDAELAVRAAHVERRIRAIGDSEAAGAFEGIARILIRSEAVASSRIEGVSPSVNNVVLAELSLEDDLSGFGDQAAEVAGNIAAVVAAVDTLGSAETVTWNDLEELQRQLLPGFSQLGLRQRQNWLGGSAIHPGEAEFIPPKPDVLPQALEDLMTFINGAATGGLIQAGLAHAQFETLHPFGDGNGRIGRALIHTVLTRRGLTSGAVLPISQVLMTWQQRYIDGLTAYRATPPAASMTGDGPPAELDISAGVNEWLDFFVTAADAAVGQAERFMQEVQSVLDEYREAIASQPAGAPRSHAVVWKLIDLLPRTPMLTQRIAEQLTGASTPSVRKALQQLNDAGITHRLSVGRGIRGHIARDLLDIVAHAERRMASTRFDTKVSAPVRPAPASPPTR